MVRIKKSEKNHKLPFDLGQLVGNLTDVPGFCRSDPAVPFMPYYSLPHLPPLKINYKSHWIKMRMVLYPKDKER